MQKIIQSTGLYILGIVSTILLSVSSNSWDISAIAKRALNPEATITQAVETFKDAPKKDVAKALPKADLQDIDNLKNAAENVPTKTE